MRKLIHAFLILIAFEAYPQQLILSDQATISLITLGPDQNDLVQAFGHSAIRVADPALGFDLAYNYGVFSFDQPNFYLNFARGHNLYYVGIASYPEFRDVYIYYNRYVHEQELNLDKVQKQKIFDYLQWNARPENRNYLYDYFFNNCSTKIRDVLAEVLGKDIRFDGSYIQTHYTIRELTDLYLQPIPWGDLGIDIGLGSLIDRPATSYEHMYMPEYLESGFDHAFVEQAGKTVPLVKVKRLVYTARPEPPEKSLIHPWMAFGALLVMALGLSAWDFKRKKLSRWFDAVLFTILGIVGMVLLLLWTATDHNACARNYNLLWALPTHALLLVWIFRQKAPGWLRYYFLVTGCVGLLLLGFWPILPQLLNHFLIPVVAAVVVRSAAWFRLAG